MKTTKILSIIFAISTIIILCVMCSVIAFKYSAMLYEIKYNGASAPASTAFIYLIPFLIFAITTASLSWILYKK